MTVTQVMRIDDPLECEVTGRINRFVVGVRIGGKSLRASINNTGRLEQYLIPGKRAYCVRHNRPQKTDVRLFAIVDGKSAAIIDTRMQMSAFEEALRLRSIPWLDGAHILRRNARLGDSLIDYLLEIDGATFYLEVKSAVLREGEYAMYPDCPTVRGRKHVSGLTSYVRGGGRATILLIAALPGVNRFKPYSQGDPHLTAMLIEAGKTGVDARAIGMLYQPEDSAIALFNPDMRVDLTF